VHAVVLVGGFGTRLRPLTNDVPKPMLPVVNRPMIVRLVDRLAEAGITDVVLALGFKPGPFAEAFPEARHGAVRVHYAVEPEPLDTAGAIAFAARTCGVDDTFLVLNGDVICDVDLPALIASHRAFGAQATIHLTPVDDPSAFGVVEIDAAGVVQRFLEKPAPGTTDSNLINGGTYVLEPGVLALIEPERRVSIERDVFPQLAQGGQLRGVATTDYWLDAGRPELYLQANLDVIRGVRRLIASEPIAPTADVAPSATIDDSVIGDACVVGPDAVVSRSVLLPYSVIGAGANVVDSIIAGSVADGAQVIRSVLGRHTTVTADHDLVDDRLPRSE
jgi:mannose-1-phosphate guanylyltransferase